MKKITTILLLLIVHYSFSQLEGTWKMAPQAGAMGVGPNQGDTSWWSNSLADVTARDCFFDDEYIFNANGTFQNVLGTQSWIEGWQGGTDSCNTPVAPHDGSASATYFYDSNANTITINGTGAFLGLAKVYNGGELTSPANAVSSITYTITSLTANLLTIDISIGTGWWRFILEKQVTSSPLEGTWKMAPQAGAMGVGPNQGDTSWWSNSLADVTTRDCFFDDEYIFNANGTFQNVLGTQSWIEGWQGGTDSCNTPVAPHDGSASATYIYDSNANTITINGTGAFLGLAKVYNGGELTSPANAVSSITYTVTSLTANLLTIDISIGGGWWRFVLEKQGIMPTCNDGIQNGDETGIDCGGSCPNACLSQIDLPVTFEDNTTNYTVTDFGGNVSSLEADPENSSNSVVKTIKTTGAQLWAGTTIGTPIGFATAIPITATETKMYVDVWSPDAGIPVRLKIEDHTDPTKSCETEAITTVIGWQNLEFDFLNEAPGTAALNTSYTFDMASIFFNFGTDGATAGEKTYYFDNISFNAPLSNQAFIKNNTIKFYPNPTTNILNFKSSTLINKVEIYSLLGNKLKTIIDENITKIDVSDLSKGCYLIIINSNNNEITEKFIVN